MEEEKFFTSGETAKLLGIHQNTLKNWAINGKLIPHHVSKFRYKYYSTEQIRNLNSSDREFTKKIQFVNSVENFISKHDISSKDRKEKQSLFKIYVDVGKNEFWLNYYVMRSGKTN